MNWHSFGLGVLFTVVSEILAVIGTELYVRHRNRDHGIYIKDWDLRR